MINHDRAVEVFDYNPDIGDLIWKVRTSNRIKVGDVAGTILATGYIHVRVDSIFYLAHRLIWLMTHKAWPVAQIDHINGRRADNKLNNLRSVDVQGNRRNAAKSKNNTSGITGVCWGKRDRKWHAQVTVDYQNKSLGWFGSLLDAACARKSAEKKYGFHPNHGRSA